jgi:hypothetical protein
MDSLPNTEPELIKFHTYLRDKGLMNPRTAYARMQAAQAVLSVLDEDEKKDLAKLDRDLAFRRFINKNGQRFTPDSLETYRHRFNAALNEFQTYLKNPSGYRPSAISRDRTGNAPGNAQASTRERQSENFVQRNAVSTRTGSLLSYPLPLGNGEVAQLLLPPAITTDDAQRITTLVAAVVNALAVNKKET